MLMARWNHHRWPAGFRSESTRMAPLGVQVVGRRKGGHRLQQAYPA
jgi:hypothetical protein